MNFLLRTCLPVLAAWATASVFAQEADDDGLDVDALFEDDFESEPAVRINDPLEKVNRAIFNFNDGLYTKVVKPFSRQYTQIVPDPVERGIGNFFDNIKFPSRFVGSVLQGKLKRAGQETGRFVVNTTVGVAGIFDAAKNVDGLNPPPEDIGQAFATWGFGHGFYVVMPFIGPTSLRDFTGNFADETVQPLPQPWSQVDKSSERYTLIAIETINDLPALMDLYDSMKRSSIDPYAAVRDAYTQRRARQVAE